MIGSAVEPEWDETERGWMLALSQWEEEELCPLCGWPKAVCQDPYAEFNLEPDEGPTRCWVSTKIANAKREFGDKGSDPSLMWSVHLK